MIERYSFFVFFLCLYFFTFANLSSPYAQNILVNPGFEDFPPANFGNNFNVPITPWVILPDAAPINIVKVDGPGGFDYGTRGPESDAVAPGAGIEQHYYDGVGGVGHAYQAFSTLDCGPDYNGTLTYTVGGYFSSRDNKAGFGEVTLVAGTGDGGAQVSGPDLSVNIPNNQTWQFVSGEFELQQATTYSYITFFDDFSNFDEALVFTLGCPTTIDLTKTANTPSVSSANTVINYDVIVSNTGNSEATNLVLIDALAPVVCPGSGDNTIATLASFSSLTCTVTYTVTQNDFDNRGGGNDQINNTVTLTGRSQAGSLQETDDEAVSLQINPSLDVVKTADEISNASVGQVIEYTYVVTNDGNQTLTNIRLSDLHNANGAPPVPGGETLSLDAGVQNDSFDTVANDGNWQSLAPGDQITFTSFYTVVQEDIDTLQ